MMIFKKSNLIGIVVFVTLLSCIHIQAQSESDQLLCRVLDSKTKYPVYYATIRFSGTNKGLIADDKGEFRLLPYSKTNESAKITISSIGYRTKEIYLSELRKDQVNIIQLLPDVEELEQVMLVSKKSAKNKKEKRPNAEAIVVEALKKLSANHTRKPSSYIAYYRDYQQPIDDSYEKVRKKNEGVEYLNLNEGIVEVFDAGFGTDYFNNQQNQTLVYRYHKNETFARDNTLSIPYDNKRKKYLENVKIPPFGGNELSVLNVTNAIRNHNKVSFSFVNVFRANFIQNHFFEVNGISYRNGQPIYEIIFKAQESVAGRKYLAKGTIFIAKENYAIHKLNYQVYEKRFKKMLYGVTMEYTPIGEKMYLNYITFNNRFQVKSDDYFKVKEKKLNVKDLYFNNEYFYVEDIFYDVYFNRKVDEASIAPIHKKFKATYSYKEDKIVVKEVVVLDDRVRVYLDKKQLFSLPNFNEKTFPDEIRLKIKNIKDVDGNVLNKTPDIKLNQYREMFVQEVFPEKDLPEDVKVMNKHTPLATSEINEFERKNEYWLNTPLKKNKTQ